jgi:hypothetical protein
MPVFHCWYLCGCGKECKRDLSYAQSPAVLAMRVFDLAGVLVFAAG